MNRYFNSSTPPLVPTRHTIFVAHSVNIDSAGEGRLLQSTEVVWTSSLFIDNNIVCNYRDGRRCCFTSSHTVYSIAHSPSNILTAHTTDSYACYGALGLDFKTTFSAFSRASISRRSLRFRIVLSLKSCLLRFGTRSPIVVTPAA